MSAQPARPATKTVVARPKKITLEDVRRKAERVQQTAQEDVERVVKAQQTRLLIFAAIGVAAAVGVAYYMGTRAARQPDVVPVPTAR